MKAFRRIFTIILTLLMVLGLAAYSESQNEETEEA